MSRFFYSAKLVSILTFLSITACSEKVDLKTGKLPKEIETSQQHPAPHDAHSIIVGYAATKSADSNIVDGTQIQRTLELENTHVISLDKAKISVDEAIATYKNDPNVLFAEPNYEINLVGKPNDAQFSLLWGMQNLGQANPKGTLGVAGVDIGAVQAWDVFTGSSSQIIAIIDSGIDYKHPDLASNMWTNLGEIPGNGKDDDNNGFIDDVHGFDFVFDDGDPMDENRHGTHVSGTIAGIGNNGQGVAGVNWKAQLMAVRCFDAKGSGLIADCLDGLNYAVKMGAKVSNNSWGGGAFSQAFFDALNNANSKGHIFVAAAGNGEMFTGTPIDNDLRMHYPSSYEVPNVIAVAAIDNKGNLASFSNYGLASVDMAGPGVAILSTSLNGTYESLSGTSMATPHVAGVVALLMAKSPSLSTSAIIDTIKNSTKPLPALAGKVASGGMVNAAQALGYKPKSGPAQVPANVQLSMVSATRVQVKWEDAGNTAEHFDIERSDSGGAFKMVGSIPGTQLSFSQDVVATLQYSFRVRAVNNQGASAYSAPQSILIPDGVPTTPELVGISSYTPGSVEVRIYHSAINPDGFIIERALAYNGPYEVVGKAPNFNLVQLSGSHNPSRSSDSFFETGLEAGKKYFYRAKAYNTYGESGYSSPNTVTVKSPIVNSGALQPPRLVSVTQSGKYMTLNLSDVNANEDGFVIERSEDGGKTFGFVALYSVVNATYLSDYNTIAGKMYHYRVYAFNGTNVSAMSNVMSLNSVPPTPSPSASPKPSNSPSPTVTPQPEVKIPASPIMVGAIAIGQTVTVSWLDLSNNEDSFQLERQYSAGAVSLAILAKNATTISETLPAGTYTYRVRATNSSGSSAFSAKASATVAAPKPPTTPVMLPYSTSGQVVTLNWLDLSGDEDGFEIEKIPTVGQTTFFKVGKNMNTYKDSAAAGTYTYRVRAYNAGGKSAYSGSVVVTIPALPLAPSNVTVDSYIAGFDIRWRDNSNNETHFEVERSYNNVTNFQLLGIGTIFSNVTQYVDLGIFQKGDYYFRVRAKNASGYSAYSPIVKVTR